MGKNLVEMLWHGEAKSFRYLVPFTLVTPCGKPPLVKHTFNLHLDLATMLSLTYASLSPLQCEYTSCEATILSCTVAS